MSNQSPTFEVVPEGIADYSTAGDALELAALAGITLLDWQAEQVRRIMAQHAGGQWWAARHGLAVPRQNGKGVVLEVVVLAATVLLGEKILWTAHEVRTMKESFTRFRAVLEGTPSLASKVKSVRTANGQEEVRFHNGAEVRFSARSKSATRGLGFRRIIADEAQELDYLTMGAMLPTLSGQGAAATQVILTGTPPYSRKGEVFRDARAAAYAGGDARLSWSEWACADEDRADDRKVWARTNPSSGVIVMESKIEDEHSALASRPDVFRRERLGEWGKSGDKRLAIDQTAWSAGSAFAGAPRSEGYGRPDRPSRFLGIDTTFERDFTCIVEAVPLADGAARLEILAVGEGLAWLSGELEGVEGLRHVAYDPARTGDLTLDLREAGIRTTGDRRVPLVSTATGRSLTLACDGLLRAVDERLLGHGDPRLDAAAACAARSTYDDGRGWKLVATDNGNVAPLIAGALALQHLRLAKPRTSGERRAVVFV